MMHEEYCDLVRELGRCRQLLRLAFEGKGKTLRAVRGFLLARIASSL